MKEMRRQKESAIAKAAAVAAVVFAQLSATLTLVAQEQQHPNVIVILTDDQGWGDLSHHGNDNLHTPHLDQLASEGVSFDRFYVCPVCSPTRAEFLTGRYHGRCGVYSTSAGGERLDLSESTIGEHFQSEGYRTSCFGKWHNGTQFPYHPMARGFDRYYGFCSGHWGHYFSPLIDDDGEITRGNGFLPDDLTDRLIQEITKQSDRPFFSYLAFNTPHSPMQVPDRWWKKFDGKALSRRNRDRGKEDQNHTRAALAMVENVDWNVGRILSALESTGQRENTLIAFFCDNGPNGARWNGDMKGRKGSTDEGGIRSPLFLSWPGTLKKGTIVKQNAAAIDLLPTLAGLAGIPVNSEKALDGVDLSEQVRSGKEKTEDDRVIISHWRNKVSAKLAQYRLDNEGNFFNLEEDPGQRTPVDPPEEVRRRLQTSVKEYKEQILPDYGKDDRPFLIGHPRHPVTQLPIRDATFKGQIQRSNRFPNSSFTQNWAKKSDQIVWEGHVVASGRFEVQLYYTVAAENVGSKLKLAYGETEQIGKVELGYQPQLVGQEEDRVPRMESYEQEWGRMTLGEISLKAGAGRLVLTATEIPGEHVMDLRLMTLRRKTMAGSEENVGSIKGQR